MKTLFDVKNDLVTIGNALAATKQDKLAEASKPDANIETIKALETKESNLQTRFDILQKEHDAMETEQKAALAAKVPKQFGANSADPKEQVKAAKASLYRATVKGQEVTPDVKAALGDHNSTGGEKILPSTMTNELLHEPFVKNPLRNRSTFTSITNLEIPKVNFTLDDDDFIADTEMAKELKVDGDVVSFGRHKFKVFAPISETILAATDTNLVQTVDRALESGLAAKERKVAFTKTPKTGEEHMSFYSTQNAIKVVTGADKYKAIKAAIADLPEDFRESATIYMTYADYMDIIETLANGSATLYNAQPEQVLGKPVEFCDLATDPVVGDFSYSHFNYDPSILYDRDKNVRTGIWDFVLTAWIDHQIKLKSAFRIAKKA
ncbi:phage major capsid protein, HK97 family [Paenibacillus sp. UNCCL117]|uniref:phage major capsid protein n=1 Tax=unclassified Paenibacillus TaxID=185978 RepID=UPI0008880F5B|nr:MULTISPECIES: phage major capsid protein [unclassified Paenibacillus]SDD27209.1 phage major capsid protein, HK97 family [Paenibacillus sp. cl123]SFW40584.1 phage major capsid protein, HK97 family [Paenibacillus sp. UNCCL117]